MSWISEAGGTRGKPVHKVGETASIPFCQSPVPLKLTTSAGVGNGDAYN